MLCCEVTILQWVRMARGEVGEREGGEADGSEEVGEWERRASSCEMSMSANNEFEKGFGRKKRRVRYDGIARKSFACSANPANRVRRV